MHVIWARGQDQNGYVHIPQSGLEAVATVSDKNFYKKDELKYHGHSAHRGVARINFFSKYVHECGTSLVCFNSINSLAQTMTCFLSNIRCVK